MEISCNSALFRVNNVTHNYSIFPLRLCEYVIASKKYQACRVGRVNNVLKRKEGEVREGGNVRVLQENVGYAYCIAE